jgi:hypothetical protein
VCPSAAGSNLASGMNEQMCFSVLPCKRTELEMGRYSIRSVADYPTDSRKLERFHYELK